MKARSTLLLGLGWVAPLVAVWPICARVHDCFGMHSSFGMPSCSDLAVTLCSVSDTAADSCKSSCVVDALGFHASAGYLPGGTAVC